MLGSLTPARIHAARLCLRAPPLQLGRQQSGPAWLSLSHRVPGSGLGIQPGSRMGKGLSREALQVRRTRRPDTVSPSSGVGPVSIPWLLAEEGLNNPRCGTSAAFSSKMPPWLDARLGAWLRTVSQSRYFRALRTASNFMATARSPFTFSRPLM